MTDILPDSRAKVARGVVMRGSQAWVPVFCANCGKDGGLCPEGMSFAFYLCNHCVETHGQIAGVMLVPDEVVWKQIREAQLNEFGRELTPHEMGSLLEEGASPLAKLIIQGR